MRGVDLAETVGAIPVAPDIPTFPELDDYRAIIQTESMIANGLGKFA